MPNDISPKVNANGGNQTIADVAFTFRWFSLRCLKAAQQFR
jgi:hypothetical protein